MKKEIEYFDVEIIRNWQDMGLDFEVGQFINVNDDGYEENESDFYYSGMYKIPKSFCKRI